MDFDGALSNAMSDAVSTNLVTGLSALLGALVGGAFILQGARWQWKRDRESELRRESRKAAVSLRGAVVTLEIAFATYEQHVATASQAIVPLGDAFNAFTLTCSVNLSLLTDPEPEGRVESHLRLTFAIARGGVEIGPIPTSMLDLIRRHATAVSGALDAHIKGDKLPQYRALPPLTDPSALAEWTASGSAL